MGIRGLLILTMVLLDPGALSLSAGEGVWVGVRAGDLVDLKSVDVGFVDDLKVIHVAPIIGAHTARIPRRTAVPGQRDAGRGGPPKPSLGP